MPQAPENFDKVTSDRGNIVSLYLFMIKGDQRGDEGQGPGQDEPEGLRRLQRHRADVVPLVQQVRHTARFIINYLCRLCSQISKDILVTVKLLTFCRFSSSGNRRHVIAL